MVLLPHAQECNAFPCDTGSPASVLATDPEFAQFNLEPVEKQPDWTSKKGFWGASTEELTERAAWVRRWLRERPEKDIVLVAHGDVLRYITSRPDEPSNYGWRNAEVRIFEFDPEFVNTDACWLFQREDVAAAGGYAQTSSEMDIVGAADEKL